jgi:hypothetical protein
MWPAAALYVVYSDYARMTSRVIVPGPITPRQMGRRRAFKTDYEVYGKRATDPRDSQVEIHIGLRPPAK